MIYCASVIVILSPRHSLPTFFFLSFCPTVNLLRPLSFLLVFAVPIETSAIKVDDLKRAPLTVKQISFVLDKGGREERVECGAPQAKGVGCCSHAEVDPPTL